ncbi:YqcI/YcgG family-domain-containing protein [Fusarium tricinctum]|uniref:YqcI/YcgG family-domain-containing protein n=1 Tax=Fusarium tricinctum TaxID=61284 RepID=A0A8K0W903_9HYPO|nr:YqcI/YcgG family-domain-containing protein [Fusarium tricinctum]
MQIAINAVILVIAFAVATKPLQIRKAFNQFIKKLKSVMNGFKLNTPASERKEATLLPDNFSKTRPFSHLELLTRDEVEGRFDENSWQGLAYYDFRSTILAKGHGMKTFPCVYATMGYRANDHRYVFLESDDPSEPHNVRKVALALAEYLRISTSLGPNTSLVIIGAPSEKQRTVEEHNRTFWDMLRGLRTCDPKAWPEDIPQDTEDANWTFCFNGESVFPVMLTPAHQERWSRHMSVPVIALQPKWVLDNLLRTPEKRKAAQSKVRSLLQKYDTIGISPDLTDYGAVGTSEVRQLCLQDKNESVQCPYRTFDS